MKRRVTLFLALSLAACFAVSPAWAAEAAKPAPKGKTPGIELATLASQVTGIAISPMLGVSGVGAYQWMGAHTDAEKAALPWFAHISFWLPALLLVGVCAAKDTIAPMLPPGMKKPLDIAETLENKVSGLVAAGAVIPSLVALGSKLITSSAGWEHAPVMVGGFGMIQLGAMDLSWLLTALMVPLSVAVFAIVWVVGHAINVLILLSPWGGLDTALKGMRTGVLSLVAATAYIDPVVGATLSVIIIVLAYFMAGWAFRLMVFGTEFTWDFFTFRHTRFQLLADGNKLFTAREIAGAPMRTYGRLHQEADGKLLFKYRPWLILAERTIEVPREGLVVGKGLFYSEVLGFDQPADKNRTLLLLPPRYRGHEELFARTYRITGTCDVGLRKAWSWLKEAFGLGAKKSQPAAA
jgi:MFS family permease